MANWKTRTQKGFTLIELLMVVAIVGILAAVAISGYTDYVGRAKLQEVMVALDAIGTTVAEYHSSQEVFPSDVSLVGPGTSRRYGTVTTQAADATHGVYGISSLSGISSSVDGCKLYLNVVYDVSSGYQKQWDTDLPAVYRPKE